MAKTTWLTPAQRLRFIEETNEKFERAVLPPPKVDLVHEITYFNNPRSFKREQEYDRYFEFTKIFPLFDRRKPRQNKPYAPDVWRNIYEQEKDKPIPVLTSMEYGRPCRVPYDFSIKEVNRRDEISDFYRRRGIIWPVEKEAHEGACGL